MNESSTPDITQQTISPWTYKPWWCQPWSIALTGVVIMSSSWLIFHRYWLTTLVALPTLTWMGFFLVIWPRLMLESGQLAELAKSKARHS